MELRYKFVFVIGIILLVILCIINFKNKKYSYKTGKKIANTKFVKENKQFKKIAKKYKLFNYMITGLFILTILLGLVLLSRPTSIKKVKENEYTRDIFLCMDVSMSVVELNGKIVDNLKETVKNLNGERFGISIFNTSSVTLVPLTNDYEYILAILDKISVSIEANLNADYSSLTEADYIMAGTLEGNEQYGSSLVGDGLASCVNSFPDLKNDQGRTRIVIFTTDNDVAGTPVFSLEEAGNFAKKNNVLVYGVATQNITSTNLSLFEKSMNITGGKLYHEASDNVDNIVKDIEKTSKSKIEGTERTIKTDIPSIPFILLLFSYLGVIFLFKKVIYR
ncbi:MAG: VWA domain-containing protein [Bacilli bacterium]|nr:VWA domain-containing protein [Bacilli bacterium]